ncbi:sensor histidine kinase [Streptomyces acidiscabies]|uniref:histidine kinase n=1 Tax=Streptomyces acidiscabies TaxID=42234 RepID=A0A0L0K460_9ACTN|nr:nitrate- and nitrite sensing domain-containing protein [Streptomyces acidiscabies]KND32400.1 histidine kinase [Streptomyces acidiscabies]
MQKTRPGRTEQSASGAGSPAGAASGVPVGKGRPTHVRNRLIIAVAVVAAAIGAAGTPSVLALSAELKDSQELVTLAERTQEALVLAHSLADERDQVTAYVATGRDKESAPDTQVTARVDRQLTDLRAAGNLPAAVSGIAAIRKNALDGKSTPLQAHEAYSKTITELHRLAEQLAQQTPPRAGAGAYALAELDSAVQQAAAARGLLVAALDVPVDDGYDTSGAAEVRDALSAAAQQARLRSDSALADFRETAPQRMVDAYDSTVTGGENDSAERYLTRLTDQPVLGDDDLKATPAAVDAALSARIELMRGVEASLFDRRTKELETLRDDDVTGLELRVALLGALMLVAVGVATGMARSLTRPLSAVRRGAGRLAEAEEPGAEEPVKFTGRNDEFAQVVRSINVLHAHAAGLHERIGTLEADRKHLVGQRQKMADAREELRTELASVTGQLERLRASIGSTFGTLSLRTLGLIERQLAVIEGLEEREQDPERLATLFKLDHFATVMRRHSENLLVLAGAEHVQQHPGPVPLVDVVRAAVSEIERYDRVRISSLPAHAHIAGFAADDLSHLLAELMENATSFSPPDLPVEVSGWLLENGDVMLSVQDEGLGIEPARRDALNTRLAESDPEVPFEDKDEEGLGLYVVSRLAGRHAVRVRLRGQKKTPGTAAVVVVPTAVLSPAPAGAVPSSTPGVVPAGVTLPGADAEVNSHVIGGRSRGKDLAVELAERAIRAAGGGVPSEGEAEAGGSSRPDGGVEGEGETEVGDAESGVAGAADAGAVAEAGEALEGEAGARGEVAEAEGGGVEAGDEDDRGEVREEAVTAASPEDPVSPEELAATPLGSGEGAAPAESGDRVEHAAAEPGDFAPRADSAEPREPVGGEPSELGELSKSGESSELAESSELTELSEPAEPPVSSETTMALFLPPAPRTVDDPRIDSGPHPGVDPSAGAVAHPEPASHPESAEHSRAEPVERVTEKGLPKRTPKVTAPEQVVRPRAGGGVDAEALRKKLGGFRRGAVAGYRDAESELAEETAAGEPPSNEGVVERGTYGHAGDTTGGTVEEASS